MKASELRIGNYFIGHQFNMPDSIFRVKWVGDKSISGESTEAKYGAGFIEGQFSGIPLTEEWLLKFGFRRHDECSFDLGDYTFKLNTFNLWDYCHDEEYLIAAGIKHVHSLQNLYFALTGEELNIKEK